MTAPIATSAIKTNRTNVIGSGLKPKCRINRNILNMSTKEASRWEKKTEAEFALWAEDKKSCDATGVNDFYGLEQLSYLSSLLSGDSIALIKYREPTRMRPYGLKIHLLEADRISTPGETYYNIYNQTVDKRTKNIIKDGVEIGKDGEIVAYHIRQTKENEKFNFIDEWIRIPAYCEFTDLPNIIQVMDTERPEQYRGVPFLSVIIEPLLQTRRYTESELMSAVIQSFFTAFIKTETPQGENPYNEAHPDGSENISKNINDYEMGPGMVNRLGPDEDIIMVESKRPSTGFDVFIKSMSEQMGAALETPSEVILKSFDASYSASRAALLEAWKSFKMRRDWFVSDFCNPIYEVWLSEAIAIGRIEAPGFFTDPLKRKGYLGIEWIGPAPGQLDPVKEVTAHILAVDNGLETREQATIELNGGNFDSNIEQLSIENQLMRNNAIDIKDLGLDINEYFNNEKRENNND